MEKTPIFKPALKTFLNTIAVLLGILVGFFLIAIFVGVAAKSRMPESNIDLREVFLPNANGELPTQILGAQAPVILQINIDKVIGDQDLTAQIIDGILIASRNGLYKGGRVKAILLHINSPGGSAIDSDLIYRAIQRYKQEYNVPVYAFSDGLCASGAFYIACSAEKIYATHVGIIGSIGVIRAPYFNVTHLMERLGIQSRTMFMGKNKDDMNPFRSWGPEEGQNQMKLIGFFYNTFLDIVVANRPRLSKEQLITDYGANVFSSPAAYELGYVDVANSSYVQTLKDLMKAAKISEDKPYQVISFEVKHSFFDYMKINSLFESLLSFSKALQGKYCYLYTPLVQ